MHHRWLVVLAVVLLGSAGPALGQVKLMDLIADSGGPGAREPVDTPPQQEFSSSPDGSEAAAGGLKLSIHSLRGKAYWWFWASATVTAEKGVDVRSVEYRLRHEGKDASATVTKKAGLTLVMKLSMSPMIQAHVTLVSGGKERVVVLEARVPSPGAKAAEAARARTPAPPRGAGTTQTLKGLPPDVRFLVKATPAMLTGGVDSGSDAFTFQLAGDAKTLRQIKRVEYSLSAVQAGDRNRNFYVEGSIPRDRWPIAVRIIWQGGKITLGKLERP